MAYFPFFTDIAGKTGLIIGGGKVALRKTRKLLPYGPVLEVVAPEICPELTGIPGLRLINREFREEDVAKADFVIAASSCREVNAQAAELCHRKRIPVNVADAPEACSFLFPALVRRGKLTVGISTGGGSPTAAVYIKEQIDQMLPDDLEEILDFLQNQRELILRGSRSEQHRRDLLKRMFYACIEQGRPMTGPELEQFFRAQEGE